MRQIFNTEISGGFGAWVLSPLELFSAFPDLKTSPTLGLVKNVLYQKAIDEQATLVTPATNYTDEGISAHMLDGYINVTGTNGNMWMSYKQLETILQQLGDLEGDGALPQMVIPLTSIASTPSYNLLDTIKGHIFLACESVVRNKRKGKNVDQMAALMQTALEGFSAPDITTEKYIEVTNHGTHYVLTTIAAPNFKYILGISDEVLPNIHPEPETLKLTQAQIEALHVWAEPHYRFGLPKLVAVEAA